MRVEPVTRSPFPPPSWFGGRLPLCSHLHLSFPPAWPQGRNFTAAWWLWENVKPKQSRRWLLPELSAWKKPNKQNLATMGIHGLDVPPSHKGPCIPHSLQFGHLPGVLLRAAGCYFFILCSGLNLTPNLYTSTNGEIMCIDLNPEENCFPLQDSWELHQSTRRGVLRPHPLQNHGCAFIRALQPAVGRSVWRVFLLPRILAWVHGVHT